MSDEVQKLPSKSVAGAERTPRPFAYRALCKVAGVVSILFALPALMAAIDGLLRLYELPHAPVWAYGVMGLLVAAALGLMALGVQVYKRRAWAAAVVALLYGYFTLLNLTKDRWIGAAGSSLVFSLCLAIVIAAWRLRRVDRSIQGDEKG